MHGQPLSAPLDSGDQSVGEHLCRLESSKVIYLSFSLIEFGKEGKDATFQTWLLITWLKAYFCA